MIQSLHRGSGKRYKETTMNMREIWKLTQTKHNRTP